MLFARRSAFLFLVFILGCSENREPVNKDDNSDSVVAEIIHIDGNLITVVFTNKGKSIFPLIRDGSSVGDFQRRLIFSDGEGSCSIFRHDQERYTIDFTDVVRILPSESYTEKIDLSNGWSSDKERKSKLWVCFVILPRILPDKMEMRPTTSKWKKIL